MGIKDWISAKFQSNPQPLVTQPTEPLVISPASIIGGNLIESSNFVKTGNRYLLGDNLYNTDERLYSAIELMAIMIQKSIGDSLGNVFGIRNDDEKITNEEKNAMDEANKFARDIKMKRLFYNYTIDLWKYGDAVDVIKTNSKGVVELRPLPMHLVTAVDRREQIGRSIAFGEQIIKNPQWYIVNETMVNTQVADEIIRKDRIFHVSFNPRRSWILDNVKRHTFNVWSIAPINSLIAILQWKAFLLRNDMLWRNRALPREWHQLDLSVFDPSKYAGNHDEKIAAARAAAEAAIKSYNTVNQRREADQGFTTGMNTKISYVEPKSTTYADPVPILDQINSLIGGPTGTPSALMGGEGGG